MATAAIPGFESFMQGAVGQALSRAADATGVDFGQLLETARRESSFDPRAKAQTSSAAGLFQFIESTWLTMVARYGAQHGMAAEAAEIDMSSGRPRVADPAAREAILAKRFDPELAARFAGELTRENAAALEKSLGRPASRGELYMAHVLGAGGAARLVRAAADGAPDAAALFPREAAANRGLFYRKDGAARAADELVARFARMVEGGGPLNAPAAVTPTVQAGAVSASSAVRGASVAPSRESAMIDVEQLRAEMTATALRALFDLVSRAGETGDRGGDFGAGGGAASRLFGLDAYTRLTRP